MISGYITNESRLFRRDDSATGSGWLHPSAQDGTPAERFWDGYAFLPPYGSLFQLLSIGTYKHEPIFFSLLPGFAVVRSTYGGKQPFLEERKAVSFGILLVGGSPQTQQTSSFFSTDSS